MSVRRAVSAGVLTLIVLGGAAVFSVAPALAALSLSSTFGSATSAVVDPEPLSEPENIAVNESSGDLYVIDRGNGRVEKFNEGGEYLAQFNGSATAAKSFAFERPEGVDPDPSGIAVDSSTSGSDASAGDVYVLDSGHDVIDKFTAAGVLLSEIKCAAGLELRGVAVDQSGDLWVDEGTPASAVVRKFNDAEPNVEIAQLPGSAGELNYGLAVDASGNYYSGNGKYAPEGAFEGDIQGGTLGAMAVDPVSGLLYTFETGRQFSPSNPTTDSLDVWNTSGMVPGGKSVPVLLEESHFVGTVGPNGEVAPGGYGIAVNGLAGKIYVTDTEDSDVVVLGFAVVPGVTASESDVLATSATFSGTVNPEGHEVSSLEFEYGTSTSYGSTAVLNAAQVGSGTSSVSVTANVTGLLPDTLYYYRLVATNENGTSSTATRELRTQLVAVSVNDKPAFASEIGQFTATLNGTINPGGAVASYHFLYSPTSAYGLSIPIPEDFTPVNYADDAVSEQIAGLQPGTTYHFALQATNGGGTATGPDETFTTLPVPTPLVSTGGASAVTRGEALLSGAIDPQGWETGYRFEYGTTTAYGSSWPSVNVSLGAFQGAQPVSVTVLNLQPGTTYHYRLVASNPGGMSYGPDMTFTTEEYPVSVIQPTPLLTASLGFYNPETAKSKTTKKPKGKRAKGKHKKHKREARPRGKKKH